jgi:hypothetical protein
VQAPDGAIYYFNFETEESTWEHPTDVRYKELYEAERQKQKLRNTQAAAADKVAALWPDGGGDGDLDVSVDTDVGTPQGLGPSAEGGGPQPKSVLKWPSAVVGGRGAPCLFFGPCLVAACLRRC